MKSPGNHISDLLKNEPSTFDNVEVWIPLPSTATIETLSASISILSKCFDVFRIGWNSVELRFNSSLQDSFLEVFFESGDISPVTNTPISVYCCQNNIALLRAIYIKDANKLGLVTHIACCDVISLKYLEIQFWKIYEELIKNPKQNTILPVTNLQYLDYICDLQKYWDDSTFKSQVQEQITIFEDSELKTRLSYDYFIRPKGNFASHCDYVIDQNLYLSIRKCCGQYKLSISDIINFSFAQFLCLSLECSEIYLEKKMTGVYHKANDVVFGNLADVFIQLLISQLDKSRNEGFAEMKKFNLDAQVTKKMVPADLIYEKFPTKARTNILFSSIEHDSAFAMFEDVKGKLTLREHIDWELYMKHDKDAELVKLRLFFKEELFENITVQRSFRQFQIFVEKLFSEEFNDYMGTICLQSTEDQRIIQEINFNKAEINFEELNTVPSHIITKSFEYPSKISVIHNNLKVTYSELIHKCCHFAKFIQSKFHLCKGDIIVHCLKRGINFVVGMLSILVCGCTYCPVHPNDPILRINSIIKSTNSPLILVDTDAINQFSTNSYNIESHKFADEGLWFPNIDPHSIAYIMHTSGSTGVPKGVCITHYSFYLLFKTFMSSPFDWSSEDVVLQMSSCTFDPHIREILCTLFTGGTVVMINEEDKMDYVRLAYILEACKVSRLYMVPSVFGLFIEFITKQNLLNCFKSIKFITFSGEPLRSSMLKSIPDFENFKVHNYYGPAEITQIILMREVTKQDLELPVVPIGYYPRQNCFIHVLNKFLTPVPIGCVGELHISGIGLLKHYLNNEEETSSKLFFHKGIGNMVYKTGDLIQIQHNKSILFHGRTDFQVKINGQRLELGEIENVILQFNGVKSCIVSKQSAMIVNKIKQPSPEYIAAYIVWATTPNLNELKMYCQSTLQNYMYPKAWVQLPFIPLNQNGKVDRKQLPTPEITKQKENIIPQNHMEVILFQIFRSVLSSNDFCITDDFFYDLGGTSLLAIYCVGLIQTEFNVSHAFTFADFIKNPSVQLLSIFLEQVLEKFNTNDKLNMKTNNKIQGPVSSIQKRILYDLLLDKGIYSHSYNHVFLYELDGIVDFNSVNSSFKDIIRMNEIFRTQFVKGERNAYNQIIIPFEKIKFEVQHHIDVDNYFVDGLVSKYLDQNHHILYNPIENEAVTPLMQVCYLQNKFKSLLLIHLHHLCFDGHTRHMMIQDINSSFNGKYKSASKFSYLDFSFWEKSLIEEKHFDEKIMELIAKIPTSNLKLPIPYDKNQDIEKLGFGKQIRKTIDLSVKTNLFKLKNQMRINLPSMGLLVYLIMLKQISQKSDISILSVTSNRSIPEVQNIYGPFFNIFPCSFNIHDSSSLSQLLVHVYQKYSECLNFSIIPWELVRNSLKRKFLNTFSMPNCFYQPEDFLTSERLFNLSYKELDDEILGCATELNVYLRKYSSLDAEMQVSLVYSLECFDTKTAEYFFQLYNIILEKINSRNLNVSIGDLLNVSSTNLLKQISTTNHDDEKEEID